MPLLNFKPQFVDPIRAGTKNHTIRADRKVPIKSGDKLYLYCGARTKNCFRILPEAQMCTKVLPIIIALTSDQVRNIVHVDGVQLDLDECARLAIADGFRDFTEMMAFWDGRLPFKGQIIHWR